MTTTPNPASEPPALDPTATEILDRYLAEIAQRLAGPRRARAAILAELHDGLTLATWTRLTDDAVLAPTLAQARRAAVAAVAELGPPQLVADAFAPELAAASSRRVALTLVATGPLVGGLWLGVLSASNLTAPLGTPLWRWPIVHLGGWPARLVLALVVTTVLTAWLTVAATGKLTRWLPARLRRPGIAAATTATGTIIVDAALLITLAVHALPTPTSTATGGLLVVAAATASLVRGAVAGRAARRCLGAHRIPN